MRETLVISDNCKDSPLNKSLKEWKIVNLASVLTVLYRYPTYYGIQYVEKGVPEVRGELILDNGMLETQVEFYRYISENTAARFHKVRLEPDDFVMSVRGTIGKIAIIPTRLKGAVITANLIRLQFNQSLVLPQWVKHFLLSKIFQNQLDLETSATTIKTIQVPVLSSIMLRRPPIPEQRRISEILDTVDEAIAHTSSLIAKLKQMKAGLLHDLLTRGLDKNGELRDAIAHSEQFKDSLLGRIPKEWSVVSINEIAVYVGSGITPRGGSNVYKKEGIIFIRSQNVTFNGLLLDEVAYIDTRTHESMKRSEVFAHDVLLNITGASIGRCCPVPEGLSKTNVNQHVCAIRLANPNREDAIFLSSVLASYIGQSQIDRLNAGGNREGLNYEQLRAFIIPFPPIDERAYIAKILDGYDTRIRTEEAYRDKLKLQKQGLMHDLLTAKVRINTAELAGDDTNDPAALTTA